jgi:predicted metallopeptidase
MRRFENRTTDSRISIAIKEAEELLHPVSKMMSDLKEKNDWQYNSGTGEEVYNKIIKCDKVAPVFFYRPWNPFTAAMGYSDGRAIYLNSRKFPSFSFESLVGLLCHEYLHLGPRFTHGNNYPSREKDNHSVNYFVSSNIRKWL